MHVPPPVSSRAHPKAFPALQSAARHLGHLDRAALIRAAALAVDARGADDGDVDERRCGGGCGEHDFVDVAMRGVVGQRGDGGHVVPVVVEAVGAGLGAKGARVDVGHGEDASAGGVDEVRRRRADG